MLFSKKVLDKLHKNEKYTDFVESNISLHEKIYGKKCDYKNCEYYKDLNNN